MVEQFILILIVDLRVLSLIPARPHTFMEIDHEIFLMSVTRESKEDGKDQESTQSSTVPESMCTEYW